MRGVLVVAVVAGLTGLAVTGCSREPIAEPAAPPASTATTSPAASPTTTRPTRGDTMTPTTTRTTTPTTGPATVPWRVGATPLPLRQDGFGQVLPTPPVLRERRLPTADLLPPPESAAFASTTSPVPAEVVARSTWRPDCPVRLDQLRYLTVSFWGFDGRRHTGELIVNATAAASIVSVFRTLHDARFPIEEMRVVTAAELTAHPTGDGNNTQAFVCRQTNDQSRWSAHAYGLALDLNPFCNPYSLGDLVLPELASAYLDRGWARPGMVRAGDVAVRAFAEIGWSWGGNWTAPRDLMHFTATGD